MILWAPKAEAQLSSSAIHSTAYLRTRLVPLHSATVLHSLIVLASPKCWGVCCNWSVPSYTASSGISLGSLTLSRGPSFNFSLWPLQSWSFYWAACSCTSTNGSPSFSQYQASAALYDPFLPSEPVPIGGLLHVTRFDCCIVVYPCPPLDHSFCVLTLRKQLPEKKLCQRCWPLISNRS